jgi:choline dehydrogenase-like flavoprotein
MSADRLDKEYDFIVVGSGAGGGPVAVRLAEAGYTVLILEAGGADEPYDYKVPAWHARSTENNELAWKFYVHHYADPKQEARDTYNYLKDVKVDGVPRTGIFYPRAGTLGGCTAHHAMIFIAPHNSDWNDIARLTGDRSWRAWRMRSYFQRLERCDYLRRPWYRRRNFGRHGYDGWMPTTIADATLLLRDSQLLRVVLAAVQTCFSCNVWYSAGLWHRFKAWLESFDDPTGLKRVGIMHRTLSWLSSLLDPNSWLHLLDGSEGPIFVPLTVKDGMRAGTREFIRDGQQRMPKKLKVRLNALATRVLLEGNRAVGVEFLDGKNLYRADPAAERHGPISAPVLQVHARREVILAGGTFNTPQLLMLSGIGDPKELARHKIKINVALRGVGRNLQDRLEVGVVHRMHDDFAILKHADLKPHDREFADWRNGHGLYATNGVVAAMLKRSNLGEPDPDLFVFGIPGHFSGYKPGYSKWGVEKNYFSWCILKGHTKNRAGRVQLASADPRDPPTINLNYFDPATPGVGEDAHALAAGIEFVRKFTGRNASLMTEIIPGLHVRTRPQLTQFVRDCAWGHHACGTCKIGADDDGDAVLDARFKVRDTQGLRVVDASIFPKIPGLFILSAIYMAAEKAADVIIADAWEIDRKREMIASRKNDIK